MLENLKNTFTKMMISPHKGDKYSGLTESGEIISITIDEIAGFQNGTPTFYITEISGEDTKETKIKKEDLVSLIMSQNLVKV